MDWSNNEKLICVQEDASVMVHDLFGKFELNFSISPKLNDTKIIDAKIFTSPQNFTGIAVMTANYKIFLLNNIQDRKTRQLSELPSKTYIILSKYILILQF